MTIKELDSVAFEEVKAGEGTSRQVLFGPEETPHFAMRRFVIQPGGFMPLHTNTVEHEQLVLAGEAQVESADGPRRVKKGDVVLIPAGEPHSYRCVSDGPFEFLCLVPNKEDKIELI